MAEAALPQTPVAGGPAVLSVRGLQAWYNESHILHGVDLDVREGEVVTLLGRNGAGKTTTLKAIMGIVRKRTGSVAFGGKELIDLSIERIARLGVALCPEERAIFASLSVKENLFLPPQIGKAGAMSADQIFSLFPNLRERLASGGGKLSGGEQQMLAIARALMTNPALLLLDEPLEGLAPIIVEELVRGLKRMIVEEGTAVILVEQHAEIALSLTENAILLERGANPNVANPYFDAYFKSIEGAPTATGGPLKGIQTPNKHTIVFHLTEATGRVVADALALPLSAAVPKEYAEKFDKNKPSNYADYEVATGPYMLKNNKEGKVLGIGYVPYKSATLVRNPNWNPKTDYRPACLNEIAIKIGGRWPPLRYVNRCERPS